MFQSFLKPRQLNKLSQFWFYKQGHHIVLNTACELQHWYLLGRALKPLPVQEVSSRVWRRLIQKGDPGNTDCSFLLLLSLFFFCSQFQRAFPCISQATHSGLWHRLPAVRRRQWPRSCSNFCCSVQNGLHDWPMRWTMKGRLSSRKASLLLSGPGCVVLGCARSRPVGGNYSWGVEWPLGRTTAGSTLGTS